jgi:hypothetical protein
MSGPHDNSRCFSCGAEDPSPCASDCRFRPGSPRFIAEGMERLAKDAFRLRDLCDVQSDEWAELEVVRMAMTETAQTVRKKAGV